jgi:trans-aconitate 2-methyltransferase
MPTWDDAQYVKFVDARTRPAAELLARVPLARPSRVVDLGCGPGNSTELLCARWPDARVTGVDSSEEMLGRARAALPLVEWIRADVAGYAPDGAVDVFFANALFQWVPDHVRLLQELFDRLAPGGVLAVQMPHNLDEPSHRLMRELQGPWSEKIAAVSARSAVCSPADYYDALSPRAASVDVWQTRYEHVLEDAGAIVEWVKGTGLRPYLDALPPGEREAYLADYEKALDAVYTQRADGRRLFSFPRLFLVAVR